MPCLKALLLQHHDLPENPHKTKVVVLGSGWGAVSFLRNLDPVTLASKPCTPCRPCWLWQADSKNGCAIPYEKLSRQTHNCANAGKYDITLVSPRWVNIECSALSWLIVDRLRWNPGLISYAQLCKCRNYFMYTPLLPGNLLQPLSSCKILQFRMKFCTHFMVVLRCLCMSDTHTCWVRVSQSFAKTLDIGDASLVVFPFLQELLLGLLSPDLYLIPSDELWMGCVAWMTRAVIQGCSWSIVLHDAFRLKSHTRVMSLKDGCQCKIVCYIVIGKQALRAFIYIFSFSPWREATWKQRLEG